MTEAVTASTLRQPFARRAESTRTRGRRSALPRGLSRIEPHRLFGYLPTAQGDQTECCARLSWLEICSFSVAMDIKCILVLTIGCGAHYPVPTQRMAEAHLAQQSAREQGAEFSPRAQVHLQLAHEEIARADRAIKAADYRRAEHLLIRAKADAELALALTREDRIRFEAERETKAQANRGVEPGAQR